ncbi:MAG: TrkA family potassium uptake protein [Halobaculum sp.]
MRAIIVGYGRVGSRTARVLDEEGHDVTVIDDVREKVERARERGFTVHEGDGTTPELLADAGVAEADGVAGLTGDPNVNFEICQLASDHDCRTVMRISEDFREEVYDEYEAAVDEVIYPEQLGAVGAKTALLGGDFNSVAELTADLQLVTFAVGENAPVVGQRVNGLELDDARVYAHGRAREDMTIPLPGTRIEAGDRLATLVEGDHVADVRERLLGT